ncbi:Microsomal epoxide hydrolase [Fusarium oxysporum f. sp. albedinis]|nr:Microsomal epoxide hydrolase [Fusarium oxysporum f. sp. albedinis]
MAQTAGPTHYKIILVGRFQRGYTQRKLKRIISNWPRFSICDNLTESPTHLVCEKAVWDCKPLIEAIELAKKRNIIICKFEWLLDVIEGQREDGNTEPNSDQILWPEEDSVQLHQADIVRWRKKFTYDKIRGLGRMVEFHLKMLNRRETRRPWRENDRTEEEKSLLEAILHLDRLIEIYPDLPFTILDDIEWSVVEHPKTAMRMRDLNYFANNTQERVFSHPITIYLHDRNKLHEVEITVEDPTVKNILKEIGSIYYKANKKWLELHEKDENGCMKPRKSDDWPHNKPYSEMEWLEKYGWDLNNHTYFKGIKGAGIGATKWEIVSLSDEESIVNLKKETKHRLYPAQLSYKRTLSDSTDPLQWDDERIKAETQMAP